MSLVEAGTQLLIGSPLNIEEILDDSCLPLRLLDLFTKVIRNVVPRVAVLLLSIQQEPPLSLQNLDTSIEIR